MAGGCGSRQQAAGMAAKQDTERPLLNKNEAKRTEWNWGEAVNTQSPPPMMYFLQSRPEHPKPSQEHHQLGGQMFQYGEPIGAISHSTHLLGQSFV